MEQKQLDELDESYFGEEFIEDDEDIKIEKVGAKSAKKSAKKTKTAKKSAKKEAVKENVVIEPIEIIEEKKIDLEDSPKIAEESKEELSKMESSIEAAETVDPWALDDENESGLFKEVSTWKAITGIAVILLILSLFTQGFNFSPTAENQITSMTILEAESKTLDFVNENLLQPPFVATIESSEELPGVFRVTLSLAGQQVDSFITKDGKFFFPQGFDTTLLSMEGTDGITTAATVDIDTTDSLEAEDTNDKSLEIVVEDEVSSEVEDSLDSAKSTEDSPAENLDETTPVTDDTSSDVPSETPTEVKIPPVAVSTSNLAVSYKKWNFAPQKLSVAKGSHVVLTFTPDESNPSFALASFKLLIPQLALEKEISGVTKVEFDATESGDLDLTCASCSSTQALAMIGKIAVE